MPDNIQTNTPSSQTSPATPAAPLNMPSPTGTPASTASTSTSTASTIPAASPSTPAPSSAPSPSAAPLTPEPDSPDLAPAEVDDSDLVSDIASRVAESHNILIALSSDPSVDELAAAIGLSIALDRAGHRATAIYSGKTPNALEFLKPEDTFESSADTLQDFVVAINKDKADHLRYKLDGDYVKIFITPYKSRIDEDDLEFSYGDFNIDLVLALNVVSGIDLDSALREHGRIMHDATIVNITTGSPGKFGEIEWSNKTASSVSELAARLLLAMSRKLDIGTDDATALLTGIVAATNHFSNSKTTPRSMEISSELLKLGANHELISENLIGEIDNNLFVTSAKSTSSGLGSLDTASLDISHSKDSLETSSDTEPANEPALPTPPEFSMPTAADITTSPSTPAVPTASTVTTEKPEKILTPSADFTAAPDSTSQNKYGQMLEAALAEATPATPVTPVASPAAVDAMLSSSAPAPSAPDTFAVPAPASEQSAIEPAFATTPEPPFAPGGTSASIASGINPAASFAPTVAAEPEINGVPEINFNAPGDILPPPPAPAIDSALPPMPDAIPSELSAPAASPSIAESSVASTAPAAPAGSSASAPSAPDAFRIPTA